MILELLLQRDDFFPSRTFGKLFVGGRYFCEVLEDADRFLEVGGEKIHGQTAIPRGRYRVILSPSVRWKGKVMPELLGVDGFSGVRFHGGNDEGDTEGCPLLGHVRNTAGPLYVRDCAGPNARLIDLIESAIERGDEVWVDVT